MFYAFAELGNLLGVETIAPLPTKHHHNQYPDSLFNASYDYNCGSTTTSSMLTQGYKDKCQQTATFEQQIRMIDRDICNQFAIRPPKANSR